MCLQTSCAFWHQAIVSSSIRFNTACAKVQLDLALLWCDTQKWYMMDNRVILICDCKVSYENYCKHFSKKFLSAVQPWRLWILCIIWKPGPDWEGWIEWCFSCKISFGWYKVAEKGEGQGSNKEWWWCNILFLSKILTICQLVLQ